MWKMFQMRLVHLQMHLPLPPADMHLCRRVLGRQICRLHMCPGHSVPLTCVGYTDTCSLISHLWHLRTITIKIRSMRIVWLIQT